MGSLGFGICGLLVAKALISFVWLKMDLEMWPTCNCKLPDNQELASMSAATVDAKGRFGC